MVFRESRRKVRVYFSYGWFHEVVFVSAVFVQERFGAPEPGCGRCPRLSVRKVRITDESRSLEEFSAQYFVNNTVKIDAGCRRGMTPVRLSLSRPDET